MTSPEQSDIEAMTDEQIIDMAVAAGLGRRMRPIGNPCQGDVFATDATYRIFARRLAAVALHPAPPPSKERLTQLLILTQFVRADAVDNAEDYDAGVTVMRIEWLHQKLAAEAANADQGRSGSLPSGGPAAARTAALRSVPALPKPYRHEETSGGGQITLYTRDQLVAYAESLAKEQKP
jgi:hypothetical protein